MVGLRPHHWPVEQEKEDLHNYIRLKYGKKTLSELILAFDLAINNELDLKTEDIKVYDQFTIAYLAQIMTGYKKWLSQQSKQVKKAPLALPEIKVLTPEEKDEWIEEWIQKEEINIELIPVIFYERLIESGKIPVPDQEQREKYLLLAASQIEKIILDDKPLIMKGDDAVNWNRRWFLFQDMKKNGFEGEFKDRILGRAQKLIVFDYLKVNANNSKTT